MTDILVSSIVKSQIPDFIRSEYPMFVTFLEKYYEWTEQNSNISKEAGDLQNANNIDLADDFYIEELKKELLPFLPVDIALDKRKFLKFATEFYKSKGTVPAIKFLFRTLFNENIDIYLPKDDIFKASDGRWALPLALRIDTADTNIFNITKTKLTGVTSKATAIVENVVKSIDRQLGIQYIEVYVSNVDRTFSTGETVYSTYYDDNNLPVTVTGRLVGSLSEININPDARGLYYKVGDPVSIVGGFDGIANTPIGAIATVGEVTQGSVTDIWVKKEGFGFRNPITDPNSSLVVFRGGFQSISDVTEAVANIDLVDTANARQMNVSRTTLETIYVIAIANVESNSILSLSTLQSFDVQPISHLTVTGEGVGYIRKPETNVLSLYAEELISNEVLLLNTVNVTNGASYFVNSSVDLTSKFAPGESFKFVIPSRYEAVRTVQTVTANTVTFEAPLENELVNAQVYSFLRKRLDRLGSLGRLKIESGGQNYRANDVLVFTGGTGYGANAIVTQVDASNSNTIIEVAFVAPANNEYIIAGEGYTQALLPSVSVVSANGSNAVIRVTEIAGDGEELDLATSRIGAISKLKVSSYGYDYVQTPTVSLRNADLVVSNITSGQVFSTNTKIYQGASNTVSTFTAYVDRYFEANNSLRIFDYAGTLNESLPLITDDGLISANVVSNSISYYGNGLARATAKFENGLIRYPGIYLNTEGFLNWDKKLQDAIRYNNFTYAIKSNYDYKFFKNTVSNIIHPAGMKVFATRIETHEVSVLGQGNVSHQIVTTLSPTFNVSNGSNLMIANTSVDLANTVTVGDTVILTNISRQINGTINVSGNVIYGTNTNFINDLLEGDTIYLESGNTVVVSNVISANNLYIANTLNITANTINLSIIYNEVRTVSNVSSNTITVDVNFRTNSNSVITILENL
jgi:hypothetical protein